MTAASPESAQQLVCSNSPEISKRRVAAQSHTTNSNTASHESFCCKVGAPVGSRMTLVSTAAASRDRAGLGHQATQCTAPPRVQVRLQRPVRTSHSLTLPSSEAEASHCPDGSGDTLRTYMHQAYCHITPPPKCRALPLHPVSLAWSMSTWNDVGCEDNTSGSCLTAMLRCYTLTAIYQPVWMNTPLGWCQLLQTVRRG